MTKTQLAKELAVSEKMHLSTAVKAIDGLTRIIAEQIAKGDVVTLAGFGKFETRDMAERQGRNLQTGEAITIPARRQVRFFPYTQLKEAVGNA